MNMDDGHTYRADPELAELLRAAAQTGTRLRVKAGSDVYLIEITAEADERNIWAGYDPEAARAAWRALAGTLPGINAEAVIQELRAGRDQHSAGRTFP